jgi:hypothetical protein
MSGFEQMSHTVEMSKFHISTFGGRNSHAARNPCGTSYLEVEIVHDIKIVTKRRKYVTNRKRHACLQQQQEVSHHGEDDICRQDFVSLINIYSHLVTLRSVTLMITQCPQNKSCPTFK